MANAKELSAEERFQRAITADVPQIYVNGFMNGLGIGDVYLVLERNGQPAAIVNMSYTTAKTLAMSVGSIIAKLEEKTGNNMLTTHDVSRLVGEEGDIE